MRLGRAGNAGAPGAPPAMDPPVGGMHDKPSNPDAARTIRLWPWDYARPCATACMCAALRFVSTLPASGLPVSSSYTFATCSGKGS